jgi:hypothetical protein
VRAPVGEKPIEPGETARLEELIAAALRHVVQEPGEAPLLADRPERALRVAAGQVYERRSQRRDRLDEPAHERGDEGGIDVPAQHGEHRKLQERALGNEGDVILDGHGRERPPALHAPLGELLPRLIAARRNERVRHFSFVDPADLPAAADEPAREELGRRRLAGARKALDEDRAAHTLRSRSPKRPVGRKTSSAMSNKKP